MTGAASGPKAGGEPREPPSGAQCWKRLVEDAAALGGHGALRVVTEPLPALPTLLGVFSSLWVVMCIFLATL